TTFQRGDTQGFLKLTGIDVRLDPDLHPMPLLEGEALTTTAGNEMLVPQTWARQVGLGVGDTLQVLVGNGFQTFQVRGIVGGATDLILGDAPQAFVTLDIINAHFSTLGARISEVSVRYTPGDAEGAAAAIDATLREPHAVLDLRGTEAALAGEQRDFRWLITLFGGIILAASGVQVLNTLAILSYQRSQELALLRTAGALRRQVVSMLVLEVLVVGLAGSLLGVALGALLTGALGGLAQAGRGVQAGTIGPDLVGVLLGFACGVLVSLIAALIPAVAASRREPLDALRASDALRESHPFRQIATGLVLVLLLVGLVAALLAAGPEADARWLLLGFAAFILLALLLVVLAITPLVVRIAGVVLQRFSHGLTHIAQQSLIWRTGRTASTATALSVAVALVTALLSLSGSASSVGRNAVSALFAAPYVLVAPEPIISDIIPELTQATGASAISPLRRVTLRWENSYVEAVALEPQFYADAPGALPLVEGDRATALAALQSEDALLVPQELARRQHLQVGATVSIWTPKSGLLPFTIVGLLQRSFPSQDPAGALVLSQRTLNAHFNLNSFTHLLVSPAGEGFGPRLQAAVQPYGLQVRSSGELVDNIDRALSDTLWLFTALTATAALVGALSIVNAMNLNVLERTRTLGLLRAAGMTRRQVAQMVLIEGFLLGLLSGFLGVLLGLSLGWLLFGAGRISQEAGFAPPVWILLLIPLSGLLTLLAALYPARVAATRSTLGTVRHHSSG
ncbi:MAG: ABC transporter permease, partial [Chloroflexota bacterium]|nr:ABC transporter permease [Chloroflexota bacterium]